MRLQLAGGVSGAADVQGGCRDAGLRADGDAAVPSPVGPVHPADCVTGKYDQAVGRSRSQPRLREKYDVEVTFLQHIREFEQFRLQALYVQRPDMDVAVRRAPPTAAALPLSTRAAPLRSPPSTLLPPRPSSVAGWEGVTYRSLGHRAVTCQGRRRAAGRPGRATGTRRLSGGDATQQAAIWRLQALQTVAERNGRLGAVVQHRLWSADEHQHTNNARRERWRARSRCMVGISVTPPPLT